jgi:adenosine deaminase
VRDFAADGVAYLELRTTPRALPAAGLTKAGYVGAVLAALAAAEREAAGAIRVRLLLSVDRRHSPAEADEAVALAEQFCAAGVVGVDLCGDPLQGDVADFTAAFARVRRFRGPAGEGEGEGGEERKLGITIHFAEAEASASAAELATILSWAPDRLGHVIHVPDDVKRQIAAAGSAVGGKPVGLELCLSCNVHAKMISGSFEAHHFGEWWRTDGVAVVPCVSALFLFPLFLLVFPMSRTGLIRTYICVYAYAYI